MSNLSIPLILLDEIALEGLEGITFESLWLRLEQRLEYYEEFQRFSGKTDVVPPKCLFTKESLQSEQFRNACLRIVLAEAKKKNVQLYQLSKSRPPITLFDRNQHYIEESGTIIYDEDQIPDNIYHPVVGVDKGPIRGTCRDFDTRENVTDSIFQYQPEILPKSNKKKSLKKSVENPLKNYQDFCKLYDRRRIVIVGSAEQRARALFGENRWPEYMEFTIECYILMELIGRQRNYGVLNVGKEAINFDDDQKLKQSIYSFRAKILQEQLIIQLLVFYYNRKRKQCSNSLVLFLPRFRPININPIDYKAVEVAKIFCNESKSLLSLSSLKSYGDGSLFKDVSPKRIRYFLQRFSRIFKVFHQRNHLWVRYLKPLSFVPSVEDLYDLRSPPAYIGKNNSKHKTDGEGEDVEDELVDEMEDDGVEEVMELDEEEEDAEDEVVEEEEETDRKIENIDGNFENDDETKEEFIEILAENVEGDVEINVDLDDEDDILEDGDFKMELEDKDVVDPVYELPNFDIPELKDLDEGDEDDEDSNIEELGKFQYKPVVVLEEDEEDRKVPIDELIKDENEENFVPKLYSLDSIARSSELGNIPLEQISTDSSSLIDVEEFRKKLSLFDSAFFDRIYLLIDSAGEIGLTTEQIHQFADIPKIYVRNAMKVLVRKGLIGIRVIAKCRSQVFHHVATRYLSSSANQSKSSSKFLPNKLNQSSSSSSTTSPLKLIKRSFKFSDILISRIELILDYLQRTRYIDNPILLRNYIAEKERDLPHRCDLRSVYRILKHLYDANFIRMYRYRLSFGLYYRNVLIVLCNHNVANVPDSTPNTTTTTTAISAESASTITPDDSPIINHLLIKNKFQFFASLLVDLNSSDIEISLITDHFNSTKCFMRNSMFQSNCNDSIVEHDSTNDFDVGNVDEIDDIDQDVTNGDKILLTLDSQQSLLMSDLHLVYQPSLAKRFGCNQHRIESMFELYRFLFYLLVNDDEDAINSTNEIQLPPPEWHKKVPKLVKFFPDRQCHPIDFLPYLPMVLIVKIFRIRFLIPGFEQLLRDPARQCEMFYEVDANVRRHLLYGRKAIGELIGHLQLMSYFGLITCINWNDRERFPERHLSFRLNTQVQLGGGVGGDPKLYQFRSISADFEPFVLDVYWHILDSECKVQSEIDNEEEEESNGLSEFNPTCPFDSRIKIHQISTVIAKRKLCKNEMIPSDDSSDEDDDSLVDDVEYKGEYNRNESKKSRKRILNNADILKRDSKKAKTIDGATEKKPKKIKKKKPNERSEERTKSGNLIFKGKSRKERINKDVVNPVQSQQRKSHTGRRQERLVWTREEDHFLLKCRLASMLMDPASRTQLCVPRSVVRDLLHQCVGPKSFSKDSLAVARRIRKFKCKPKLKRLLRFCLHELDYIELDENSGETNENFTATPQFSNRLERNESENWIAQYKKVLQQILSHDFVCTEFFLDKSQIKQRKLMATAENITANKSRIPRNLPIAELLERFEIVNPYQQSVRCYFEQDPKNYYDIHSYVISNILMSSLLSVKFIEYYRQSPPSTTLTAQNSQLHWSRRLFLRTVYKSLKHFPEMVVRWILKRLNQFEIISHNKRHVSSLGEGESNGRKPLNCYAYRITANFFNQLIASNVRFNRSGSTRSAWIDNDLSSDCTTSTDLGKTTTTTIIKDTNSVFSALQFIECFTADILGISTSSTPPSSESPSNLNSELPSVQKLASIKFDVKIPERFISKTSSKSDIQGQPQGPGAKKLTSLSRILLMRRKNADGNHHEQDDEEETAMSTTTTQNGAQISSTNNPFHEEMNVNHCKVQIRRSGPEPAAQCLQDTEILNLLKFHLRVFDTSEEFPKHSSTSTDNFKIFDFSEYKSLVREGPDRATNDLITEKNFTELIEFIRSKKELGAKMDKLLEFLGVEQRDLDDQGQRNLEEDVQDGPCLLYDDDDFDEDINPIPEILSQEDEEISAELARPGIEDQVAHFLRFCESLKLIFCVGIMEPTWVHRESIHFWLVPSYENLDPQPKVIGGDELPTESSSAAESGPSIPVNIRTISFLPKIWKLPNGQLNREVLFAYFNQIIGFLCFEKPKIEQSELLEHFRSLAPPVQLLELLEMLTEIGCLRKLLVRTPVADPYRPLCFDHYFMEPDELALEIQRLTRGQTKKQIFYEPTNDTYTRLAFLYRALEPGAPSGIASTTLSQ